ncbi:MAG: MltA domain-containing protein [Alphaproteobacteria bacterium]|nr:MltA domain-containing protein [Alphaproteobacteria bacterium]
MLKYAFLFCVFIGLNGCFSEKPDTEQGKLRLQAGAFADLTGWQHDDFAEVISPFARNCAAILKNKNQYIYDSAIAIETAKYQKVCQKFNAANIRNGAEMRRFIENNFEVYAVSDDGEYTGKFTSYYEAIIHASLEKHGKYKYPIYGRPKDLIEANIRDFDGSLPNMRLVGRVEGGKFVPYYNRRDIENNGVNAPVLMWGDDLVDIHIMQIQGSAIAKMDDGAELRIGFADSNGRQFRGIGSILIEKKLIDKNQASMPKIREWLQKNPEKAAELMKENDRFIFQKISDADGPQGAMGVSLTAGRSMAVDSRYIPLGTVLWLDTTNPDHKPLQKIVFAQDIGSAIKGVVRGDYFWGHGEEALQQAGRMNSSGRYYVIVPKNSVAAK